MSGAVARKGASWLMEPNQERTSVMDSFSGILKSLGSKALFGWLVCVLVQVVANEIDLPLTEAKLYRPQRHSSLNTYLLKIIDMPECLLHACVMKESVIDTLVFSLALVFSAARSSQSIRPAE